MVKTKIVEWQHFFLILDRFYHNRSVSSPRQQLSKPTRVQKKWKFTPNDGRNEKDLGVVENNHSCCSAFLSGFSRCWAWDFQPNKSQDFCPIRWADLGQTGAAVSVAESGDYHWYLSAQRAPDLPCSTASSMESITVAYLSWKSMLKRKEFVTGRFNNWIGSLIEKTAAGRKKGNLASGLLVVVSAVLSLYVVQDYIGTATTQWRSESDMTKVELKSDKRFLEWRK